MHLKDPKIVHRDLKPENVMMAAIDKKNFEVIVIDFGFACFYDPKLELGKDEFLGTPAYMAPEIIKGEMYTEKVDVWAIGIIMFMLLCGEMLYHGKDAKKTLKLVLEGNDDE
jgi:serine/threonine protein kinase